MCMLTSIHIFGRLLGRQEVDQFDYISCGTIASECSVIAHCG
jgi:hypothetical protein